MKTGQIGPQDHIIKGNFLPWETDYKEVNSVQTVDEPSQISANYEPNIEYWRNMWAKNNACVIPNLLPDQAAWDLQQYYFNQPKDFWDLAVFPDPFGHYEEGEYPLYRCKPNDPSIPDRIKYTLGCNDRGEFAYMYRRTENYHPHLELFSSPEFISQLEYITGYEDLQFNWDMTFISCYEPGHFNGPHTDGMNGRIAFVYHLSPDWKPWNGGLFARMDDEWKQTTALVVPDFNKFAMFNVFGDGYGAPHLVTEVAQGCTKKRISYTGWYQ